MQARPKAVNIISWFIILTSALVLISSFLVKIDSQIVQNETRLSISLVYAWAYIGSSIGIICGIGMLKRQNWARYVYVFWGICGIFFNLLTMPTMAKIIPGAILLIVFIYFLFRPTSNQYFTEKAD